MKHQKSLSQSQTQFTEQQKNIKKSGSKQTLSHLILTSLKQDLHSQKLSQGSLESNEDNMSDFQIATH